MAPLKHVTVSDGNKNVIDLPCLKRHGSIEAQMPDYLYQFPTLLLPCLKRHGSIEAAGVGL